MPRPLLFLDVDGVLNPIAEVPPAGYRRCRIGVDDDAVWIHPAHGTWIAELRTRYEVIWATGWNQEANRLLGPVLDIPELPVLTMPAAPFHPREKVPIIERYAGARPTAWIDDAHTPEARRWCAARREPTLLLPTLPALGLTRACVEQALAWAEQLREHPAERR